MDYAIYKTNDGKHPRIIHRFTQEACNHKAKNEARKKLDEMWRHVLQRPNLNKNAQDSKDDFSYDYVTSTDTTERIRFYIAKM